MQTKEKILHTATTLFNRLGTARVTTNLIAEEAGISPGNLYYHYQDKAHIIREIYEQMIQEWEGVYLEAEGQAMSERALQKFIQGNFEMLWRYRFFSREAIALVNADEALAGRSVEVNKARFERQGGLLQKAVREGFLRFPNPGAPAEDVLSIAWVVANHYLIHLESFGHVVEQRDFEAGAALVLKIFAPYLNG